MRIGNTSRRIRRAREGSFRIRKRIACRIQGQPARRPREDARALRQQSRLVEHRQSRAQAGHTRGMRRADGAGFPRAQTRAETGEA